MEYQDLINSLEDIRKKYPKILKDYTEVGRAYRIAFARNMIMVYEQYASQPLRDHAVVKMMELEEITNKWQKAEFEYTLITNEQRILQLQAKLLMADDYSRGKSGEYGR